MTDTPTATPTITSRPKPMLTTEHWPAFTTHTERDVIVAALSLARLVDWCGTPCVHTADAVVPGSDGRPSDSELASVLLTRVVSAEWRSDLRLHVAIDADLGGCRPYLEQARLIGRTSTAYAASVTLESDAPGTVGYATSLPADISAGDLIVIPCIGVTLLHDIKVASAPWNGRLSR